jgi:hypothetical protein
MLKKKITAKIDKVIKTGSVEEEQVKELKTLETLFPEDSGVKDTKKEQKTDEETPEMPSE